MYDAELQEILDDADWFVDKGAYKYVDILCTLDGTVVKFDRGDLAKDAVTSWAPHSAQSTDSAEPLTRFKLLCMQPADLEDFPKSKLLATKHLYESLQQAWNLPIWTLRFLSNGHGNSSVMPFGALAPATKGRAKPYGVAVKNANSHRMVTIYDPDTRTVSTVLCESPRSDPTTEQILDRIEKSQEATLFPVLVPFILIESLESEINDIESGHRRRIEAVERKTYFYAFDDEDDDDDDEKGDLVDYTREYTKLHALSRSLQMSLDDALQCNMLLQQMHEHWYDRLNPTEQTQVADRWDELNERLLLVERMLRKNTLYIKHNLDGIQLSIQTIYALIGNNDSQLNYSTAQASLRIAEDSRKVAVLARQDSTDMRVIAATTLIFLPATFVATLFSTNFFNFQPKSNGLVSHWLWLYFAVSAGLTIAVMGAWRLLAKRRAAETQKILGPPSYDDVKSNDGEGDGDDAEPTSPVQDDEQPAKEERSSTSGMSFEEIKNRLSKRKKTRTMEMEENRSEEEDQNAKS